jgi:hypothetical protein
VGLAIATTVAFVDSVGQQTGDLFCWVSRNAFLCSDLRYFGGAGFSNFRSGGAYFAAMYCVDKRVAV